jgi:hypothetical protein
MEIFGFPGHLPLPESGSSISLKLSLFTFVIRICIHPQLSFSGSSPLESNPCFGLAPYWNQTSTSGSLRVVQFWDFRFARRDGKLGIKA